MSKFKVKPNVHDPLEIEVEADDFKNQDNGNLTFYITKTTTTKNNFGQDVERYSHFNVASFSPGSWKMVTKVSDEAGEKQ